MFFVLEFNCGKDESTKNLKRRISEFLVSPQNATQRQFVCCNFCGTIFSLTVQNGPHKCTMVSRNVLCIFNLARDRRSICLSIILDLELYCMALRRFVYCELKNHVYQLKNNQTCQTDASTRGRHLDSIIRID